MVTALVTGADDRPIFFARSKHGFGLGYLRLSSAPRGGELTGAPGCFISGHEVQRVALSCATALPSSSDLPLPTNFARLLAEADF